MESSGGIPTCRMPRNISLSVNNCDAVNCKFVLY